MMRKLFFILFGMLSVSYFSQALNKMNLEDAISFYYLMDYKNPDTSKNSGQQMFVLNIYNGRSIFSSVKNIKRDSILEVQKNQFKSGQTSFSMKGVPRTAFTYYIEKSPLKNTIKNYDQIGGKNFIFTETENNFAWKITNEKKVIQGFDCNKATVTKYGRNFIAWFSKDIPVFDGAYKFFGLPGLILELYDDAQNYRFHLVKFDPLDKSTIQIPSYRIDKVIVTDKKKFMEGKINYNTNIVERARSMGLNMNDQQAKLLRDKASNRIIPLELEYD